jgi:2-octaprenyl-6-methoxyphenol hydroxylase
VRQVDNLLMFAITDGLGRLFSTDRRLVRMVRDVGTEGVNRLSPVKRVFMRRAMGVTAA